MKSNQPICSFADEGGVYHFQYKVLMIFADMNIEKFSLFDSCDDKIGIIENPNQTCSSSNWTCLEHSSLGSGLGCKICKSN